MDSLIKWPVMREEFPSHDVPGRWQFQRRQHKQRFCTRHFHPGALFNIKMPPYQYRKSHCGDKTILRPSYLHNGISNTGKTTSLYWIRAQMCFRGDYVERNYKQTSIQNNSAPTWLNGYRRCIRKFFADMRRLKQIKSIPLIFKRTRHKVCPLQRLETLWEYYPKLWYNMSSPGGSVRALNKHNENWWCIFTSVKWVIIH